MLNGWILAGGRARRFGSDKALYVVDGEPLVLRTARVLSEAGLLPGIVARAPRGLGLRERLEPPGEVHPLHGVACALETGPALVTPVDLVALEVAQVRRLLAAAADHPDGVYARGQPLLAVLPGHLGPLAAEAARRGDPVRAFVADLLAVDLGPLPNLNHRPD